MCPPMSHSVIRTVIDMKFLSVSDLCVQGVNSGSYAQLVNSCVHTSLVSRPEVYLKFTSDVNRSNCSVSRLFCRRGNGFSSKEPKYTSK